MEILKLLRANIKHKKGAFKSVIALMAIIVLSFTGTVSNNDNIDRTIDEAYKWSDSPDMTIFMDEKYADDKTLEAIKNNPDVIDLTTVKSALCDDIYINNQSAEKGLLLLPDSHKLYRVFNEKETGYIENPEPLKEGEIYIPYSMKGLYDIEAGSEIIIDIPKDKTPDSERVKFQMKVKGFIADPKFSSAFMAPGRFFISDADIEKMRTYSKIVELDIHLRNGADYIKVKKSLDNSCGLLENAMSIFTKEECISYTTIYSDVGSRIVLAFVILLLVITMITIFHSISSSVDMEYVNLGVLKSQGFTTGKIRLVYILQYIIAEIIGAAIGLLLSVPLLMILGTLFQSITGLVTIQRVSFIKCGLLSIGIIAVSAVFILLSTRKISKISPVRAISGGKSEVYFDSRLNVPIRKKALSFFMGLRQFTSRLKSYAGILFISVLLVYFMMTIIMLSDRLSGENIIPDFKSNVDIFFTEEFQFNDIDEIEKTVNEVDKDAEILFSSGSYVIVDDVELFCEAESSCDKMYQPLDGRLPLYDNEISITEIVSDMLDKEIGDTITVGTGKNKRDYIVSGYHQSVAELGRTILVTVEGYYKQTGTVPYICSVKLADVSLIDKLCDTIKQKHSKIIMDTEIVSKSDGSDDSLYILVDAICIVLEIIVFAISIAFSAVVISMVCSRTFVKERTDIGILKSLGFTAKSLRVQFAFRFMIIALIGSVLGGIASYFLAPPLLEALLKIVGLTRIEAKITPAIFFIPSIAISASFFLFSYIAARKIKKVEVRELVSE